MSNFNVARGIARRLGYDLVRGRRRHPDTTSDGLPPDFSSEDRETWEAVRPYTMTSPERIASLCNVVRYVVKHRIPGSIVECGVWKGGSMMAVARTLQTLKTCERDLYLFDTFTEMPPPDAADIDFLGRSANALLSRAKASSWLRAENDLETTRANVLSVGYPAERLHFVQGLVEDTIPGKAPSEIAILRLDTDWYKSTKHELDHLFPRLSPHGVLIIDDYGHWQGAQRAVDEYFETGRTPLMLHRIDYTGRIAVKPLDPTGDSAVSLTGS